MILGHGHIMFSQIHIMQYCPLCVCKMWRTLKCPTFAISARNLPKKYPTTLPNISAITLAQLNNHFRHIYRKLIINAPELPSPGDSSPKRPRARRDAGPWRKHAPHSSQNEKECCGQISKALGPLELPDFRHRNTAAVRVGRDKTETKRNI